MTIARDSLVRPSSLGAGTKLAKKVRALPAADTSCGWLETLPPLPPARRLEGELDADCAVVGAGFTGLAAARRLTELCPEWRVVVLEAQRAGSGTSGRASGFVVDLTDFATRLRPADRRRYVQLARSGINELRGLVERHRIDCAWDETGWIRAAAGPAGERFLDKMPALYEELEMTYQPLDHAAMVRVTGSSFYRRGLRLPGYPLVHSAALARGLCRVLPASVELYEETPVTAIEGGPPYRLRAAGGSVRAGRLFLAVNGYTPAFGFLAHRIFPLYTFGSLTRVLTPRERELLGGEDEWGILAMDSMGSSVRRTRDQRILIRNTLGYDKGLKVRADRRREIRDEHRKAFRSRFPMLEDVELEFTWACLMGTAHNAQMSFGELRPRLYAAAAYSAAGIAMGTTAGRLLADLAVGLDSEPLRDVRRLPRPTWMPPEPFRSLAGGWLAKRMNAQAGEYL